MYRWHKDRPIAERNLANRIRAHLDPSDPKPHPFLGQPGRFRKKDAWDCGQARCITCHYSKILKVKTHREIAADLDFKEWLEE